MSSVRGNCVSFHGYVGRADLLHISVTVKGGNSGRWLVDATGGNVTCDGVNVSRTEDVVRFLVTRQYCRVALVPGGDGEKVLTCHFETTEEPEE